MEMVSVVHRSGIACPTTSNRIRISPLLPEDEDLTSKHAGYYQRALVDESGMI
jgi:hypothetical protein